jgi:hypothetical protein
MRTQLVDQYLRQHEVRHGLYLVGWYLCDAWEKEGDQRKAEALRHEWDFKTTVEQLQSMAQVISSR